MTDPRALQAAREAHDFGAVTHEEFADGIIMLEQKRSGQSAVFKPYMGAETKIAMARLDHYRQGKKLHIEPPRYIVDDDDIVVVQVVVVSEIYGSAVGTAQSKKKPVTKTNRKTGEIYESSGAEQEFPHEIAETSAIARALSNLGYGIFAGSGLASAEDMRRVSPGTSNAPRPTPARPPTAPTQTAPASADVSAPVGDGKKEHQAHANTQQANGTPVALAYEVLNNPNGKPFIRFYADKNFIQPVAQTEPFTGGTQENEIKMISLMGSPASMKPEHVKPGTRAAVPFAVKTDENGFVYAAERVKSNGVQANSAAN